MHVTEARKMLIKKIRDHDYIYDPNYFVSHHKDFDRQAVKSAMASSQCTVHPIFDSMFSDLTKYKRIQVVCHPNARLPSHIDISYSKNLTHTQTSNRFQNIEGKNRALFFSAPKLQQPSARQAKYEEERKAASVPLESICIEEDKVHDKGIQTLHRESSAQTEPYQSDFYVSKKCKVAPEILQIDDTQSSHQGNILSVQRQRIRRAWLQRALDFKILSQLDQHEFKYRETELEMMLSMQEEKLGKHIPTTVDRDKLNKLWAQGSQKLHKKITQIRHNNERELRKLEAKHTKLKRTRHECCRSMFMKKPVKLAVDLNYLPNNDDFNYQTIDTNPRVKNKYGVCDKFMKKHERHMVEIKKEFKKLLEPEEDITEDMSWKAEEEEEDVKSTSILQVVAPQTERIDRSVATDFLLFILDTGCESIQKANLEEQFVQIKKNIMKYILESLNMELNHVLAERVLKEMSENTEKEYQDREIMEKIIIKEKTSKQQLQMYQEVVQITQEISSAILNEMFEEVSQKISAEKSHTKSASLKIVRSKSEFIKNSTTSIKNKASRQDSNESLLADVIMDMILPLVVEEIESRQTGVHTSLQGNKINQTSNVSFSVGSFMDSLLAELVGSTNIEEESAETVAHSEQTALNMDTDMSGVVHIVHRAGLDILDAIFADISLKLASREFRMKHGLDEYQQQNILSSTSASISGVAFVKEIIMHELLPQVIEDLRRRNKMDSDSDIGLGETLDDNLGNMIKVVGVVQNVASDILNDMIQETTQQSFSRIKNTQSSISTKIKRAFITDVMMDTLMPQVVEEIRRGNRARCGYPNEDDDTFQIVQVIQGAASDILNVMFTAQPHSTEVRQGIPICLCSEEVPLEKYMWNLIIASLPKNIRAEIDPRYYFDINQETTESYVWNLVVESLPKHIKEDVYSSKDITQMSQVVRLVQMAASQMFSEMFVQASQEIPSSHSLNRTHSSDSFFMEIIEHTVMPRVMKEIQRRERSSLSATLTEKGEDDSQISKIVEKVTSGILDAILATSDSTNK